MQQLCVDGCSVTFKVNEIEGNQLVMISEEN